MRLRRRPADVLGLLTLDTRQMSARLSPEHPVRRDRGVVLDPRSLDPASMLGAIELGQLQGAVLGAPLPLRPERADHAWPQIVGLVAGTILLFVIGYVVFQRQEVRA